MSLSDMMTVSRSGILSHQQRLEAISHNIANVNTDGYRRQKVVLDTNPPKIPLLNESRDYSIGAGVTVSDVMRTFDQMKEGMLLDAGSDSEFHSQKSAALSELEVMLTGMGDASMSALLQDFWSSWQDVANNADSLAFRNVLLERSETLTDYINSVSGVLDDYRTAILSGVGPAATGTAANIVSNINNQAQAIQDLNDQIFRASGSYNSNDLMDKRDAMIRELGSMVNINVASDYEITIDSEILVNSTGTTANQLSVTSGASPVTFTLDVNPVVITGGALGAWVSVTDGIAADVDSLITVLDNLATSLLNSVNGVHGGGAAYDLNGDVGIDLFTVDGSGNLVLNFTDPSLIAAAATTGGPGDPNESDGAKALEIAQLAHDDTIALLSNQTFDEYYNTALVALGAEIDSEMNAGVDSDSVVDMLSNAIQSESGVNLDEEMIDMMSAQRAYEASARVMRTVDEMMELVINGLKR